MRYGGVIALVIATLSAWSQECGQVTVRGPEELVAGGIWSLAAHWTALPPGKNINIRIDAPAPFTVLSVPAEGRADSGVARPVFMTSAHAEARAYWIRVSFEGACLWGKVDDSLRVRVLAKPRLIAKIISAGKDSANVLITNTGNVAFDCGEALIPPTESYEYKLYRKDNKVSFSAQSANGWDTLV